MSPVAVAGRQIVEEKDMGAKRVVCVCVYIGGHIQLRRRRQQRPIWASPRRRRCLSVIYESEASHECLVVFFAPILLLIPCYHHFSFGAITVDGHLWIT